MILFLIQIGKTAQRSVVCMFLYKFGLITCLIDFFFMPFFFPNCKLKGKNEAVLCQADVLSKEEQKQEEVPQVPCISENTLCEQSR